MRIPALAVPLALALTLLGAPVRAGDPARADALFKEGRQAFDRKDFPAACARFEESQRADPAAGTLLNLALCEEKLGKLLPARKHAGEVLASLPAKDDRLPLVLELVSRLDRRIPTLTLTLAPGAPGDTTVRDERDGRTLAFGTPEPMEPGEHDLTIRALGRPESHLALTLVERKQEKRSVTVAAATPESVAAVPRDEPPSSAPTRRIVGIAAGSLGVAGFITAGVTGALLLSRKSAVDAQCPDKHCTAEGLRLKSAAEKTPLLPVNTAAWIVGIAGVGAGAALILTSLGSSAPRPKTAFVYYPFPLDGGAGLGAAGSF
jgi:hypothetical protein